MKRSKGLLFYYYHILPSAPVVEEKEAKDSKRYTTNPKKYS